MKSFGVFAGVEAFDAKVTVTNAGNRAVPYLGTCIKLGFGRTNPDYTVAGVQNPFREEGRSAGAGLVAWEPVAFAYLFAQPRLKEFAMRACEIGSETPTNLELDSGIIVSHGVSITRRFTLTFEGRNHDWFYYRVVAFYGTPDAPQTVETLGYEPIGR